jgi:hypothetical protein
MNDQARILCWPSGVLTGVEDDVQESVTRHVGFEPTERAEVAHILNGTAGAEAKEPESHFSAKIIN